ncbi:RluA family pseudouridine synthase [Cellvibrio japonicus]|nr:RNA pseudouridine synthase [Cellvibrio japonicus]QEI12142.1 RNA pseudouridine synthase [Cellvibrio japonicus]QEI15716.1 RNA pseudouridine synthase [Cellvibrio japonicus]QEI19294.1 RNA pseudouridine synthase [Cellvibrio japonicus]
MPTTFDVILDRPQTAIDALAHHTGLSRQKLKDAMNKGACWWTSKGKQLRLRRATKDLPAGTRLQLFYDEKVLALKPEAPQRLEDVGRYSVWYKPHGLLAQGSQWGDHCSLLRWVEVVRQRECFLVHRLDADAAGLILIAHDAQAAAALSQLFQGRSLRKHYQAWVSGELQATGLRLEQPLDGKDALTWVNTAVIDQPNNRSLVDVRIETGRKHQIRRHLAAIGHPIMGDKLYGQANQQPLQLLAWQLGFECPLLKRPITISLPEPLKFRL